ncbi:MAG: DUF2278 family protein [Pseudonocardiaceae bacterium]
MPLTRYGVLVGRVLESRAEGGSDSPHFQIRVRGGDVDFRVAVNVLSQQSPSELLYVADEAFQHPLVQALPDLPEGFTLVPSRPGGLAVDYIRGNLFDRRAMRALPATAPGPDNDLADKLEHYVSRAAADPAARIYAFGERWGPEEGRPDKIFGFSPGNGVHDIHMNQGNTGRFRRDDGVWQDGGLLLHYPGADQWVAIFLAFQSQAWHTDDQTGHTLADLPTPGPAPTPGPTEPDHVVRIVAALVNPVGPAPERETVTLLNTGAQDLDLGGWALLDRLKQRMPLDPSTLPAGEATRIQLRPPIQLGNQGGLLTLLNPAGLKVDGVAYTQQQAEAEGRTIVF